MATKHRTRLSLSLKAEGVLPANVVVRTSKYLNNLVEQDHRRVKQRYYPMLGFKRFGNAAVTISGIELIQKIKKGQARHLKHQPRRDGSSASVGGRAGCVRCHLS